MPCPSIISDPMTNNKFVAGFSTPGACDNQMLNYELPVDPFVKQASNVNNPIDADGHFTPVDPLASYASGIKTNNLNGLTIFKAQLMKSKMQDLKIQINSFSMFFH